MALVTGGAGFIGSHMVDLLINKKFSVIVIDNLSGGHIKNIKHHLKNKNFKFLKKDLFSININSHIFNNLSYIFHLQEKEILFHQFKIHRFILIQIYLAQLTF